MKFITKQHCGELTRFIKDRKPYEIELASGTLRDAQNIAKWCEENFQDDGAAKIVGNRRDAKDILIKWYMVSKLDYVAFKLTWT